MNPELPRVLAELLQATFSTTDNAVLKEAQVRLKAIYTESLHFFEGMLKIMSDPSFSTKVKTSAATNLRYFLRQAQEENRLVEDSRVQLILSIFSVLVCPALDTQTRSTLGYSLSFLLSSKQAYPHQGYISVVAQPIMQALQGSFCEIMGGLRALKAVFNCVEHSSQVNEMFAAALPFLVNIGQKGLLQLTQAIAATDESLAGEGMEVLGSWGSVVTAVLEHYSMSDDRMMRELLKIDEIPEILGSLVSFVLPGEASLISTSTQTLAVKLNEIKAHSIQCLNIVIQFLIDNRKRTLEDTGVKAMVVVGVELPNSAYVQRVRQLTESLIDSMVLLCSVEDLDEVLQLDSVSSVLVEILALLFKTVSDRSFYTTYANYARTLIVQVCLTLLKVTEADLISFIETPQEFVAAATDVCERQESETYKTASAKLLEGLCDYIDGILSFTVSFVIQAIDFALTGKDFTLISNYKLLEPFAQSSLLAAKHEHIADVGLVVLCIISYALEKRKDLMKALEELLRVHLQSLVQAKSGLLNSRLCLLFYFYCSSIFADDDHAFVTLFKLLLDCLIPSANPKAVNIQACETLSYLVQDDEVQLRLAALVNSFFTFLVESLPQQGEIAFFDALYEILYNFTDAIEYPPHEIAARLALKVEGETKDFLTRQQTGLKVLDFTVIVKCYQCIRTLLESEALTSDQLVSPR
jgi:hypothetical protein